MTDAIADTPVPVPAATNLSLAGIRVLVVDDDADSRTVATTGLQLSGATTLEAASSADALGRVTSFEPTVIICDLGMPQEDGFAFVTKLRALPENGGGRTPAIALTAHAAPQDRLRALTAGFQMHLPKPVNLDALAAAVAALSGLVSE